MAWRILKAHGEQDGPDVDARLYLYEIGDEGREPRRIEALIAGPARLPNNPDERVRRAVETDGQSAVETVLAELGDDVEPPARINVTAKGIGYE